MLVAMRALIENLASKGGVSWKVEMMGDVEEWWREGGDTQEFVFATMFFIFLIAQLQ